MKKEYTKDTLIQVVSNCNTMRQVLLEFNRNQSAFSYRSLRKKLVEWDINIEHFLTNSQVTKKLYAEGKLKKIKSEDLFVENSSSGRSTIKKRILDEKLIPYQCFKCSNKGEWMGETISLILDHKNGVNNDHRLENLRFTCPNCDATLETHCQGSKALKLKEPKIDKRKLSPDRINMRKVVWPTKIVLGDLLISHSYTSLARAYGVSDTTIRTWCKKYGLLV